MMSASNNVTAMLSNRSLECYETVPEGLWHGSNICIVLVSSLIVLLSAGMNSIILYCLGKNRTLRSVNNILIGALASINLLSVLGAQLPFLLRKALELLGVCQPANSAFCRLIWKIAVTGAKICFGYAITLVFGITMDRYIATIHAYYYCTRKKTTFKVIAFAIPLQTVDLVLSLAFEWYLPMRKAVTTLQIVGIHVFVIVAYAKIYLKLKAMATNDPSQNDGLSMARHSRLAVTSTIEFVTYLVCYVPIAVAQIFRFFVKDEFLCFFHPWFLLMSFASAAINPVAYGFRNGKLGQAVRASMKKLLGCKLKGGLGSSQVRSVAPEY